MPRMAEGRKIPYLPPCRVCESKASGFHYGVNTCEACKGFYRRSIARKTPYSKCTVGGKCVMQMECRNSCSSCRYKKCIDVGMNKSAIKTGRYTHEKRTSDTLEIKQKSSAAGDLPSPSIPCNGSSDLESSSSAKSCRDSSQPPCFPISAIPLQIDSMYNTICDAFRTCFPDTAYMYVHTDEINSMVAKILKARNIVELEHVITCPFNSAFEIQESCIRILTTKEEVLSSMERQNSSLSGDLLWDLPGFKLDPKELYDAWYYNLDKFVIDTVQFAKRLPVFSSLPSQDRCILIRCVRPEVASLIKFKHYHNNLKASIDCKISSATLTIYPKRCVKLWTDSPDHSQLVLNFEEKMASLNMHINSLAVICAMELFSPDRDELSEDGKQMVADFQEQLIPVLHHALNATHQKEKSALAKSIMLLPTLRSLNDYNIRALITAQHQLFPGLSYTLPDAPSVIVNSAADALVKSAADALVKSAADASSLAEADAFEKHQHISKLNSA